MDMVVGEQIAPAGLTDWRKLAQGLHARFLIGDFSVGARLLTAIGKAGDDVGHHPSVSMGESYVDLKLVSDDATYRPDDASEIVVQGVTQPASGRIVDDSDSPSLTAIADQDGNLGVLVVDTAAANG